MSQNFANGGGLTLPVPVTQGGTGVTTSTGSGANVLGTAPTINQPNVVGVTDGSNATAGSLGEFVFSEIALASAIAITNTIVANVTSISLTAGDWQLWGNVSGAFSAFVGTLVRGWISTTSATMPDLGLVGGFSLNSAVLSTVSVATPALRLSLSATTTVYLSGRCNFGSGTATMCGNIYARRVR